ncbi:polysaccharide pyruvyl transferase family protein [soil metagenome]
MSYRPRVLVLWADNQSANLGVRVLAEGMAQLARDAWGPNVDIQFQDFAAGESDTAFGGRAVLANIVKKHGPITQKVSSFDAILDTGAGDSFTDIYGLKRLLVMAYTHRSIHAARIPLVVGPQTIGPFNSRLGRSFGRHMLKNAASVTARDSLSASYAATLGTVVDASATDVVFALPSPKPLPKSRDILLNVSGLLWNENSHVDFRMYRAGLIELVQKMQSTGRSITLLAHVLDNPTIDNDLRVLDEAREAFGPLLDMLIPIDLEDARQSMASATLVVGSRMHACLNAISVGTPAISLAYSRKFAPLMADLKWPYVIDLKSSEHFSSSAMTMIERIEDSGLSELQATRALADERLEVARMALRQINLGATSQ